MAGEEILTQLEEIQQKGLQQLQGVQDEESLLSWRSEFLGRKAPVMTVFSKMGEASKEMRPLIGQKANEVKAALESALEVRTSTIKQGALERSLRDEKLDVTLPGRRSPVGRRGHRLQRRRPRQFRWWPGGHARRGPPLASPRERHEPGPRDRRRNREPLAVGGPPKRDSVWPTRARVPEGLRAGPVMPPPLRTRTASEGFTHRLRRCQVQGRALSIVRPGLGGKIRLQPRCTVLLSLEHPVTGQPRVVVEIALNEASHQVFVLVLPAKAQHVPLAGRA